MTTYTSSHEAFVVADLKSVGTRFSDLIAAVEKLIAIYGPSILATLPSLLTAAAVPAWMVPLIVAVASAIVDQLPKPTV